MLKRQDLFPVTVEAERCAERRRFLRAAGGAAVLAIAGGWTARRLEAAGSQTFEVRLDLGHPLSVGEARAVAARGGGEALVVRLDESTLVGFARRCPHLGCPVLWAADRGRFECPCHEAAFDARTGRVLFGPPRRGLDPVTVRSA